MQALGLAAVSIVHSGFLSQASVYSNPLNVLIGEESLSVEIYIGVSCLETINSSPFQKRIT
jgi:hypothetical protein